MVKLIKVLFILLISLTGCIPTNGKLDQPVKTTTVSSPLPDFGPAPELTGDTWLNVEKPLRSTDLLGKVVLVDMWTFG